MDVKIERSWKEALAGEFEKPYFESLVSTLHQEKRSGRVIYPPGPLIFNAFNLTPIDQVKVVIIGQDPYHGPGQAEGLSFSVPHGITPPPSLKNIYKEIESDLGVTLHKDGSLEGWARQGVFLLNAILTVRAGAPASHSRIGWAEFTDAVIRTLSERRDGLVFLLWGNFARSKKALIDTSKHHILEAAHPSPLAGGAFFGCRHFSKTNAILESEGLTPIDWTL
ncbi:MAG: uracil-DNA glycosylase [Bacteroidales bacterium]|nr:uracil-DNA glycosylase [Bacteroidales bacterium]